MRWRFIIPLVAATAWYIDHSPAFATVATVNHFTPIQLPIPLTPPTPPANVTAFAVDDLNAAIAAAGVAFPHEAACFTIIRDGLAAKQSEVTGLATGFVKLLQKAAIAKAIGENDDCAIMCTHARNIISVPALGAIGTTIARQVPTICDLARQIVQ